jgi:hypothetical protein
MPMSFKDQVVNDRAVFLNGNEFGATHQIQYRQGHGPESITAIVDEQRLTERAMKEYDGVYIGEILYYASVDAFETEIHKGDYQYFDGKYYRVEDVRTEDGMYEIILNKGS